MIGYVAYDPVGLRSPGIRFSPCLDAPSGSYFRRRFRRSLQGKWRQAVRWWWLWEILALVALLWLTTDVGSVRNAHLAIGLAFAGMWLAVLALSVAHFGCLTYRALRYLLGLEIRFSLRTLMLFVLSAGCLVAYWVNMVGTCGDAAPERFCALAFGFLTALSLYLDQGSYAQEELARAEARASRS